MNKIIRSSLLGVSLALASTAWADSPESLKVKDSHSVESQGTLTLYRVQVKDMGMGLGKEAVEAEVFVTLDSEKDTVFTLQVPKDSPPTMLIAQMLREAFLSKTPVTIYHQVGPAKKNVKILMVQMGR